MPKGVLLGTLVLKVIYTIVLTLQSTFDISNSEGSGENVRDSQSSRYRETGLKQKKSPDILYLQIHFHITCDIP